MNPASFFNLVNFIEMIVIVLMFDIDFEQEFIDFIQGLRSSFRLPDVVHYFYVPRLKENLPSKFSRVGITSSMFIVNCGTLLLVLLGICLMCFSYFLIRKTKKNIIQKIKVFLDSFFRYNIFLRFLIQSCFEVPLALFISLKYEKFGSTITYIDKITVCIAIVRST